MFEIFEFFEFSWHIRENNECIYKYNPLNSPIDYFEKDLEIQFLQALKENSNSLKMEDTKRILIPRLNPTGSCTEPSPTITGEIKIHQRIGNFSEERRRIFVNGWVTYERATTQRQCSDKLRRLKIKQVKRVNSGKICEKVITNASDIAGYYIEKIVS